MSTRSWALLGLLSAIWGSSYLLIAVGLVDFGPAALVFLRVALAALVVTPFAWRGRRALRSRLAMLPLVAATQVAVPFLLIGAAEQRIPSGLAGVLVATQPLWLVVLAPVLRSGRRGVVSVLGTVVGFGGVALVVGFDGAGSADLLGAVMVLGAALAYAVGAWLARRTMTGVPPMTQTWAAMVLSSVLVAPVAAFQVPAHVGWTSAGAVALLAVVGTAAGFAVYLKLIQDAGPDRASLVSYLAPGFALAYGALLLHERVTAGAVAGLALILAGSWLSTRTSLRGSPRRRSAVAVRSEREAPSGAGSGRPVCPDAAR